MKTNHFQDQRSQPEIDYTEIYRKEWAFKQFYEKYSKLHDYCERDMALFVQSCATIGEEATERN